MPDELHVDEAAGIIKIRSYGVVTRADIEASMERTRQLIEEKGVNRVLVDTRDQETMPGTLDIYELFSTLPHQIRAALLVQTDQATKEDQRFAETVSLNRGIQVHLFQSEEMALLWLKQQ